MNMFYKSIFLASLVVVAPIAFALTEQEVLIQLGQLELRAQVLDVKSSQVAGGSTMWDKRGLLEEWGIVFAEAQKVQNAIAVITPLCESFAPQTQTLTCPAGQDGRITQTRISTCPGPSWSEWTTTANNCVSKSIITIPTVLPTSPPVVNVPAPVVILGGNQPVTLAQGQQNPPTTVVPPSTPPSTTPPPAQPSSSSGGSIVPCGDQTDAATGQITNPCEFRHFIIGINNIINFLIMIGGSIAALVFAYAGFLVLTAGGNEAQVKTAKGMFWAVLKGFALMLAAWLLVKMVLVGLGVPDAFSFLGA